MIIIFAKTVGMDLGIQDLDILMEIWTFNIGK